MQLTLDDSFTKEEKKYINQYVVQITLGKFALIDSKNLSPFLSRLSYPNQHKDKNDVSLTVTQKNALAVKLITCIMRNDEAFVKIIMADTTLLYQFSNLPPLRQLQNEIFNKAATTLQTNTEARESLIKSISDISTLVELGSIFQRALLNVNDLDRLLATREELYNELKRFPKLIVFLLSSIVKTKPLLDRLFLSDVELDELQQFLSSQNIPSNRINSIKQQILKTRGQHDKTYELPLSNSSTPTPFWESREPKLAAGNPNQNQHKHDEQHALQEQVFEIEQMCSTLTAKLNTLNKSAESLQY